MSQQLIECEGVNLERALKRFRDTPVFCVNQDVSDLMPFQAAMRQAAATDGSVWYVPENYVHVAAAPVKPDYTAPLPEILSRTKRGGRK